MYGPILAVFHGGGGSDSYWGPQISCSDLILGRGVPRWGGGGGPVTTRAKGWRRSSRAVLL